MLTALNIEDVRQHAKLLHAAQTQDEMLRRFIYAFTFAESAERKFLLTAFDLLQKGGDK